MAVPAAAGLPAHGLPASHPSYVPPFPASMPVCIDAGCSPPKLQACRPVVPPSSSGVSPMNSIVYIVGAVVIVIAILSFLGLR